MSPLLAILLSVMAFVGVSIMIVSYSDKLNRGQVVGAVISLIAVAIFWIHLTCDAQNYDAVMTQVHATPDAQYEAAVSGNPISMRDYCTNMSRRTSERFADCVAQIELEREIRGGE